MKENKRKYKKIYDQKPYFIHHWALNNINSHINCQFPPSLECILYYMFFLFQIHLRGPGVGVKNSVGVMSERFCQLEAALEAQAEALK